MVIFFVFDVLHSFCAAFTLRWFLEYHEKKHWDETREELKEIKKPRWVDYPATTFFIGKTLILLASFVMLGTEFYYRIFVDRP